MAFNSENISRAEISHNLADFISKFAAPPTMAIVAAVAISLWSPIGLGHLQPPLSILLCFLLFAFFPFLPVLYCYKKKAVDLYVSRKEMRTNFFIIAITLYAIAAIIFYATNTQIIFLLALGYTFVTIILLLVNRYWKVSVHSAGVTGPIFALIFEFGIMVLPLSLIIVLVSWSRIKLKKHTFTQTLAGSLIPITVGLVIYPTLHPLA
jgi:membrane-associated phospholipid phosphatase